MKRYDKVILVGQYNVCDTIMAEAILKQLAADKPLEVISRGLVVLFPEPVNPKVVTILENNQLPLPKEMSEQLVIEDVQGETLILTITEAQTQKILQKYAPDCDVMALREFCNLTGDVPIPNGDLENYQNSFEHMDLLMRVTAQQLFEPYNPEVDERLAEQLQGEVGQLVDKVYADTMRRTLGKKKEAELSADTRQSKEEELTAEYLEIVEKTQAREAAREAAKEESEFKQRINEVKARLAQQEEEMWGDGTIWEDSENQDSDQA